MNFSKAVRVGLGAAALLGAASFASSAAAAHWSRAYVVDWLEPAFYHDGPADDNAAAGKDCPQGTTAHVDYLQQLRTVWRQSDADIEYFMDPEHRPDLMRVLRYRGPNYDDVWENPTLGPDFHMPEVQGTVSYGFDLDGDAATGGFTSPDGAKGVDNGYYKVGGCWVSYRGEAYTSQRGVGINGYMRNGLYTIVIVLSGDGEPMNDENATLAFYQSKDRIVKDALGAVAHDATFNIKPDPRTQSLVPVTIHNGVIETKGPTEIRLRDEDWNSRMPDQLKLEKGRLNIKMDEDGGLLGYLGGYRDWRVLYRKQAVNGRDTEMLQALDLPSFYYSLERNADYDPDPVTGKNRQISTAYRIRAVPAFVMDPAGVRVVTGPEVFDGEQPSRLAAQ